MPSSSPSSIQAEIFDRRVRAVSLFLVGVGFWVILEFARGFNGLEIGVLGVGYAGIALVPLVRAGKEFPARPGRPTIARAREVRVTDYLHPMALWSCMLSAVIGFAIVVASVRGAGIDHGATNQELIGLG
ncbi:MAG: hypothetical protein ACRDV1_12160, partial [Actinomycetes bacterium]